MSNAVQICFVVFIVICCGYYQFYHGNDEITNLLHQTVPLFDLLMFKLLLFNFNHEYEEVKLNMNVPNEPISLEIRESDNPQLQPIFRLPSYDEDKGERKRAIWILFDILIGISPFKDVETTFTQNQIESLKQHQQSNTDWDKYLNTISYRFAGIQDCTSDEAMTWIAFNSPYSYFTKQINNNTKHIDPLLTDSKLNKAKFIIDFRHLCDFEVRDTFEKYGVAAYFDEYYKIIGIYQCSKEKLVIPSECSTAEWEKAKWSLRTNLFVEMTLKDHLAESHLIIAQAVVVATRENIPFNHWLRRFLKIFSYGTVFVNHKTLLTLLPKYGMLHRGSALTYQGLLDLMQYVMNNYRFETLPEKFSKNNLNDVPDEHLPFRFEVLNYWKLTKDFVTEYMHLYWNENHIDDYIVTWWRKLKVLLKINQHPQLQELNMDNLIIVLTQFISTVTLWHECVGNTAQEMVMMPNYFGMKVRPHQHTSDIQSYIQLSNLAIGTSEHQPNLINDILWRSVVSNDSAIVIFEKWQSKLKDMSAEVVMRNQNRTIPIWCVDPAKMDVSIAV